jgi:hypothetical protein
MDVAGGQCVFVTGDIIKDVISLGVRLCGDSRNEQGEAEITVGCPVYSSTINKFGATPEDGFDLGVFSSTGKHLVRARRGFVTSSTVKNNTFVVCMSFATVKIFESTSPLYSPAPDDLSNSADVQADDDSRYPHKCPSCDGPSYNDPIFGRTDCKGGCNA